LTGRKIFAQEALAIGLINEIVPKADVLNRARELARVFLKQPDINRRYTRMLITEVIRREMNGMLGFGLAAEGLGIVQ
jgi:enoyl-CoA hydratase/carnithine racemase